MGVKLFNVFIIICFLFSGISAQSNPQPYYRNYSTADGLPSPETYCIFEDSKGYIWFGTDNGIARFDGYQFKNYSAHEGLTSNVVFDIYEDQRHRIWMGTLTGEVFILDQDTIRPYIYNHLLKKYNHRYNTIGLGQIDEQGTAYFEMANYGLLKIDKNGNIDSIVGIAPHALLIIQNDQQKESMAIMTSRIEAINNENQSKTKDLSFDIITNNNRFQKKINQAKSHSYTADATWLPSGELLVFYNHQLYCLRDSNLLWSIPFSYDVSEIVADSKGNIWLCLLKGEGVYQYSNLDAIKSNDYQHYFKGLSISNILEDSNGAYWISSQEKGAFYMPDIHLQTFDSRFGLSDDFVSSISIKNMEQLFVGLYNEDIYEINTSKKEAIFVGKSLKPYHNLSLFYDHQSDKLWGGTFYYQGQKLGHFKYKNSLNEASKKISPEALDNLHFNGKGYLVGDIPFAGLCLLDLENNNIVYSAWSDTLRGRVYGLFSDSKDRLWVGRANGLFEFKDSSFVRPKPQHPAFFHRIEDIQELPDQSLVMGSKGFGVIIWKDETILQLTQEDGLCSNMIEDIHVDKNGTLWVATLNGLNKITIEHNSLTNIRSFTVSNGLPSNEIYQIDSFEDQLWFCTNKGLVKFHEKPENPFAIPPEIQWIKINGKEQNTVNSYFKYDENNFEIRYLSINYPLDGKINYRYRINANTEWQYTQGLTVNYPSLSSGQYDFEVQSQNEDQYWSTSSYYSFMIHPVWWKTSWFSILVFGILLSAIYLFYRRRIRKIKHDNAIQNQINELKKSALQAQMNPHFMFNSLNSIQNFILKNDKIKAVKYLARFAKLVRHNLDASINGIVSIDEEMTMLDNYLALEQERFNHRFNYHISHSNSIDTDLLEMPTMLIQPFVENAVIHGMANKETDGQIDIHFNKKNNFLQVSIIDNGPGFTQKKNKIASHQSVGVGITKQRLNLLGTPNGNNIDMKELKDEHGKVKGTQVNVFILIEEDHNNKK